MLRAIKYLALPTLALAVALSLSGDAFARGGRGGGGYGGGGYHGGYYGGGGYHGGWNGGWNNGWNGGYYHNGYGWGDGYRGWGWGGLGYGLGYYGWPGYGSYGYASSYYNPSYDTGYYDDNAYQEGSYAQGPSDQYGTGEEYGGATANAVRIRVRVPASAKLWFDGSQTRQTGSIREFESPALTPGQSYTYTVKATWNENGQPVTRSRDITVQAGQRVSVDLLNASTQPNNDMGNRTYDRGRLPAGTNRPPLNNGNGNGGTDSNPDRGDRPPTNPGDRPPTF